VREEREIVGARGEDSKRKRERQQETKRERL
jgi:hypothetical protein